MTRALAFVIRNWPLKLAAIGLAAVLYGGLVVSEDTRTWSGQATIMVVDPPAGGVLLDAPGSVTSVRYRAPLEVVGQLTSGSFRATVDLSGLTPEPGGRPVTVPVQLVATDPRVAVVDFSPRTVEIRLDSIVGRTMPVTVERGVAPEGLVLGPPQVEPSTIRLRGGSTQLAQARSVVARIAVDGSGLNIDQVVDLEVVDEAGDLVSGIELTPAEARVRIDVARELAYAALPVVADITGAPAPGHRVAGVTVDPVTVTVSGEAPAVERLVSIATEPIPVDGRTTDLEATVSLLLPPDITLIGEAQATVRVAIVPVRVSRVLEAGLALTGARRDRQTTLSTSRILVTVSGESARLDALERGEAGLLIGQVDVTGLGNGRHELPVTVGAPDGVTVVAIAPRTVVARIAPAAATPVPSVAPSGGPVPPVSPAPSEVAAASATAPGPSVPPSVQPVVVRQAPTPTVSATPQPSGGS